MYYNWTAIDRMICLFGILFMANAILSFPSGNSQKDPFSCHWPYLRRCAESSQPTFEIRKPWLSTLNLNKGNENLQIGRILSSILTMPGNNYDKAVNEHRSSSQNLKSENPYHDIHIPSYSNKNMNKDTENLQGVRILPSTFTTTRKSYEKSTNEQKACSQDLHSKKPSPDSYFFEVFDETTASAKGNQIFLADDSNSKINNLNVINTETPTDTDDNNTTTEDNTATTEEQEDTTEESLYRISELSPAVVASLLGG